jgi:SAM-dependent methyltransferase
MNARPTQPLEFSKKYDADHARYYFEKHETGFWRRLSNWRDHQIARQALRMAGAPLSVLDAPCGTGRFWDVLAEDPQRVIHASDNSQSMIDTGLALRPPEIAARVQTFQASIFDLPVEDDFVDCAFCIRFAHHLGLPEQRLALLRELHRVAAKSVILSLWVDGNYQTWRRKRHEARKRESGAVKAFQNRFVTPVVVAEEEFRQAGFEIGARLDFLPFYSAWRTYVLFKRT